jgi:hypothetical protein
MNRYEDLKRFFAIYVDTMLDLSGLAEEHHPMAVLAAMEKQAPSRAKEGLRIALSDVIAALEHASVDELALLTTQLEAANAPSIAAVRALVSKRVAKVLRRGTIINETEFYMMKEVLDDHGVPEEERRIIEAMLDRFEASEPGQSVDP